MLAKNIDAFDPCDTFDLTQCDPAAECFSDKRQKPECRCPPGHVRFPRLNSQFVRKIQVDLSTDPKQPGRKCQKVPVTPRKDGMCSVNDPLSCDSQKSEVCIFTDGIYRCDCPKDYGRLADGRCLKINECI